MKKMLYITHLSGKRISGFMLSAILAAHEEKIDFTMACNMEMADKKGYEEDCKEYKIKTVHIGFDRNPVSLKNISAFRQLRSLIYKEQYDLVHCNTPIGGVIGRICAKRAKIQRVIYQAHGFHFYKGAPLKNWLLYYPVEWLLAHWTDVLITINKEDYALAQKHMHAKRVEYVPGVGIDLQKFAPNRLSQEEKNCLRESIGVGKEDKLLLSVGELNTNKNHAVVIRAIAKLQNPSIHYAIAGTGDMRDELLNLAGELGVADRVHLLGYRNDVADLYQAADLYIHPSKREGLPVALMEAIASKVPVICSDIRGNSDLASKSALFKCTDIYEISEKIKKYLDGDFDYEIERNYQILIKYDIKEIISQLKTIYTEGT